jgi:hypothetical protein
LVFKKFLEKNGKKYGPYLYENKRVGQKIVTNYLGKSSAENPTNNESLFRNKKLIVGLYIFLVVVAILLILDIFLQISPTGRIALNINPVYNEGENLSGISEITFNGGELIPKETLVYASLGEQKKVFNLNEVIEQESIFGDYYASNTFISGSGEGYGLEGEKITYPALSFELFVFLDESAENQEEAQENTSEYDDSDSQTETGENQEEQNLENNIPEDLPSIPLAPIENPVQKDSENDNSDTDSSSSNSDSSDSSDSSSSSESSPITGEIIMETEYQINAETSKDNSFTYTLENLQGARIVKGSVKYNGETISDNNLKLKKSGNKIVVTTDYSIKEKGFGKDFLTDKVVSLPISLRKLGIEAENNTLEIKLVYQENIITSSQIQVKTLPSDENLILEELNESVNLSLALIKDIPTIRIKSVEEFNLNLSEYFLNAEEYGFNVDNITGILEEDSLTISADSGFKGSRKARVIAYRKDRQEMLESNEFFIFVSSGNISISTSRNAIKVGEEVKWTANISLDNPETISVDLPSSAENVIVSKIKEDQMEEIIPEIKKVYNGGEEIIQKASEEVPSNSITGNVAIDVKLKKKNSLFKWIANKLRGITGHAIHETLEQNTETQNLLVSISQEENATNYVIEYTTPAPESFEENKSYGKQVVISAPSELNYTDVLSFANIPETYSIGEENKIKIFWKENNSYVNFDAYDLDENNLIDYVEWITPHLSNQTFEIILITKAEHLDSSRNFVEDVYEQVKAKDGNYTLIPSGDYLRVRFERNLTLGKDMTIYAKANCNNSILINNIEVPCDVYYKKLRLEELRAQLT